MSVRVLASVVLLVGTASADEPIHTPVHGTINVPSGAGSRVRANRAPIAQKKIAQATVKVTCDVIEISAATGKDAAIDPALKAMEKKLAKQPWAFNQYKLVSQSSKSLEKGKQESLDLKSNGASATAKLVETVDKSKVRLTLTEDHGGKRVVDVTQTIAAADWLIVGHPVGSNKDGHLVAISCK